MKWCLLFLTNSFHHIWVYVNEVTFGKHLMGGGWLPMGTTINEGLEISGPPNFARRGMEVEPMAKDVIPRT